MPEPVRGNVSDPIFRSDPLRAPEHYPFPRTADGLLPWKHAEARLAAARNYWLATARPDGPPHLTPVWGVWIDASLYFDGLAGTQWGSNLSADPRATVHLESAEDVVIVEGIVHDAVTDPETGARIAAAWDAKYASLIPEPAARGIYRLVPERARGWSHSALKDGTRWTPER